jgi:DNA adenine methylase
MFQYSFGAIFKGSWAKNKKNTDYVKECVKNILIQSKNIQNVKFYCSDYITLKIPSNSLIYCDPPYMNAITYNNKSFFNHNIFWNWARQKQKEGHKVFISEYNAPDDFKCIWEKEINCTVKKNNNKLKRIEKLFVYDI